MNAIVVAWQPTPPTIRETVREKTACQDSIIPIPQGGQEGGGGDLTRFRAQRNMLRARADKWADSRHQETWFVAAFRTYVCRSTRGPGQTRCLVG